MNAPVKRAIPIFSFVAGCLRRRGTGFFFFPAVAAFFRGDCFTRLRIPVQQGLNQHTTGNKLREQNLKIVHYLQKFSPPIKAKRHIHTI
jgi:hypothetical protein